MKKLILIFLSVGYLGINPIFSQEIILQKIPQNRSSTLSIQSKNTLEKIKKSNTYNDVLLLNLIAHKSTFNQNSFSIDLPALGKSKNQKLTLNKLANNKNTWHGTNDQIDLLLIHNGNKTYGQLNIENEVYDISYLENGIVVLSKYDSEFLEKKQCDQTDLNEKDDHENTNEYSNDKSSTKNIVNTIDVLVLFTPAAERNNRGQSIPERVELAAGQWETARGNSNVRPIMNIVRVLPFNFDETDNFRKDLNRLIKNQQAKTLRSGFAADIVVLVADDVDDERAGRAGTLDLDKDRAFAIVRHNSINSGLTFIHELGHLMGARHQKSADKRGPTDAHGHSWETTGGVKFRSIMFTNNANGGRRVTHFSNPSIEHMGEPTGISGRSNNAKIINRNAGTVARFKTRSDIPVDVRVEGPTFADTGELLNYTARPIGKTGPFTYSWSTTGSTRLRQPRNQSSFSVIMTDNDNITVTVNVTDGSGETFTGRATVINNKVVDRGDSPDPGFAGPEGGFGDFIETDVEKISIYPNPATDEINVNLPENFGENSTIRIVNIQGKEIFSVIGGKIKNNQTKIDISGFNNGTYIIQFIGTNEVKALIFVKK